MRRLDIKTLPPKKDSWVDRDCIMLHAAFQLLVDFIEEEDGLNHCDYESHKETIDEAKSLYDWWKEYSITSTLKIDDKIADENLMRLVKIRGFLWT